MGQRECETLGSARVSGAGVGVSPTRTFRPRIAFGASDSDVRNRSHARSSPPALKYIVALSLLVVSSNAVSETAAAPVAPAAQVHSVGQLDVIDDDAVDENILTQIDKLTKAKKAVKGSVLAAQLKRKSCHVDLAPVAAQPIPNPEFYARLRRSVLVLAAPYKCPKCHKTHLNTAAGFALNTTGVCATNYHVVIKNQSLFGMTPDGTVYPVKEVLAASEPDDIAIVQLDGAATVPLPLAPDTPVGAHIRVISHPDGGYYSLTEGIVSRYFVIDTGKLGRVPGMAITADYARGSSGSPVLDDSGAVTGMVASTRSIYYDEHHGRQTDLQMVIKECVPAACILKLVSGTAAAVSQTQ